MADNEKTFSLAQANDAHIQLRNVLGLGPERFPLPAFVGMLCDEIDQLRASGRSDAEIAELVTNATGQRVEAKDITENYVAPDERGPG